MKTHLFKPSIVLSLFAVILYPVQYSAAENDNHIFLPVIHRCTAPLQPLTNGDFEQGSSSWVIDQWGMASVESSIFDFSPYEGNWMGFLPGAIFGDFIPSIQQTVTVPGCSPYLAFWWSARTGCGIVSGDRCGTFLRISINNQWFKTITAELDQPWHKTVVDLSPYRGQTVLLSFDNYNVRDSTLIALDDISFQSSLEP